MAEHPCKEALVSFERACRLAPGEAQSHNDLSVTYRKLKDPVKAIRSFDAVLQIDGHHIAAHFNLGLTHHNNQPKDAIRHFERYLALTPNADDAAQVREWIQKLQRQP